jgi:hypothetical protein
MKYVFPTVWIGGLGLVVLASLFAAREFAPLLLVIWFAGSGLIYASCLRLKSVGMDEAFLYIGGVFREWRVPLDEIAEVQERRLINTRPVFILFKHRQECGTYVMFMPPLSASLLRPHPVVEELRRIAAGT